MNIGSIFFKNAYVPAQFTLAKTKIPFQSSNPFPYYHVPPFYPGDQAGLESVKAAQTRHHLIKKPVVDSHSLNGSLDSIMFILTDKEFDHYADALFKD